MRAETTVVIRASTQGKKIVAGLSLRDRLIKGLIKLGCRKIYLLGGQRDYVEEANQEKVTISVISSFDEIGQGLLLNDNFIIKDAALLDILRLWVRSEIYDASGIKLGYVERGQAEVKSVVLDEEDCVVFGLTSDKTSMEKKLFMWHRKDVEGLIGRKINRPISNAISRYLARFPLKPNFYSLLNGLMAVGMVAVLMSGKSYSISIGCLLYYLVALFDCIDGDLARVKYQASKFGALLDTMIDMVTNMSFIAALAYALWQVYGQSILIVNMAALGLAFSGVCMMIMILRLGPGGGSFDILEKVIRVRMKNSPGLLRFFNVFNSFLKRDFFTLFFAILGLAGFGLYIPWIFLVGLVLWNLAILGNARHIIRFKDEQ